MEGGQFNTEQVRPDIVSEFLAQNPALGEYCKSAQANNREV
jgi:hypothetical protein